MKEYDIIAIGTGSAMNIVSPLLDQLPDIKVAVVESGPVGGICLTRGCIPSKLILYPAELVETIKQAKEFGITVRIEDIDFEHIMNSMRENIGEDSQMITRGLQGSPNIDFYHSTGEFIADHTMKVKDEVIKGKTILISSGSRPFIPNITGLKETGYLTSTSFLTLKQRPQSMAIIGGGYIAAEYGHFLAAMGSKVTIIGRNPQFVPQEEPEVSDLLKAKLSERMDILTGVEVKKVEKISGMKRVYGVMKGTGEEVIVEAEEILIAAGRASYSKLLKPEKSGVKTDARGWIIVDDKMQTSQPNIWAFGDAIGKHLFKHVANMESQVAFYNAFTEHEMKVDYHAVPSAIFTSPEVASVGMREAESREQGHNILIGKYLYENTAKGQAIGAKDYFVKVLVDKADSRILGAHIIGPQASVLIQEIINLMNTPSGSWDPIGDGMHIHPALSEVVERAFLNLYDPDAHLHQHSHDHQGHDHSHEHSDHGYDGHDHSHGNGHHDHSEHDHSDANNDHSHDHSPDHGGHDPPHGSHTSEH